MTFYFKDMHECYKELSNKTLGLKRYDLIHKIDWFKAYEIFTGKRRR